MSLARWTPVLIALSACSPHANPGLPADALPIVALPWHGLAADASLAGTVRTASGDPISGAQVCAWHDFPEQLPVDARAPVCTTTRSGAFEIHGLAPGAWHVHVSGAMYQPGALDSPATVLPGQQHGGLDLVLTPGGAELRGQIVDLHGAPIQGAVVTNFLVTHPVPERGAASLIRSDADGRFSLWVKPGHHHIVAEAPGFTRTVAFHDTAMPPLRVHLAPESTISGTVLDSTTRLPVTGARVRVIAHEPIWPALTTSVYTDAAGAYRIPGLPPGEFTVLAETGNRRGDADRDVVLGLARAATLPPIALTSLPSVRARVIACGGGHVDLRDGIREAIGPDGEVFIPALEPGPRELEIHCHDHTLGYASFEATTTPLTDLFWRPGDRVQPGRHAIADPGLGVVHGLVVDPRGEPVQHANIHLLTPGDSGDDIPFQSSTTAAGAFAIHDIAPGEYNLTIAGPGSEPTRTAHSKILVEPGTLREVRLTLPVTRAPIHGLVVQGGAPIAGALVTTNHDTPPDFAVPRHNWNFAAPFTFTDADGRFTLGRIHAPEEPIVWALAPGGQGFAPVHTNPEAVVEIAHHTTLAGSLTGIAPPRFAVAVLGPGEFIAHRTFQHTDGRWGFEEIPPGTHDLLLLSRVGCAETQLDVIPGERREDLVLTPGRAGGLRGRVLDGLTHEPAPFANIHFSHHDARLAPLERDLGWYSATTDADGRFEFLGLCPGEIEVSASLGSYAATARTLLPPGEVAGLSLALLPTGVRDFD